jgi:hypothetical protein
VTVDPAQAERFELSEIEPLEVLIEDDTAVLNGLELRLLTSRVRQVHQRGAEPRQRSD